MPITNEKITQNIFFLFTFFSVRIALYYNIILYSNIITAQIFLATGIFLILGQRRPGIYQKRLTGIDVCWIHL